MDQLKALFKALRTEQRQSRRKRLLTGSSIGSNHLFLFLVALGLANPPAVTALFCIILVLILPALFRDPMHHIPKDRYQLMPLPIWKARAFPWIARLSNPLLLVILSLALWLDTRLLLLFPVGLWIPSLLEGLFDKISALLKRLACGRKPLLDLPFRSFPLYLNVLKRHAQSLDVLAALLMCLWALPNIHEARRPAMVSGVLFILTITMGSQAQRLLALEHPGEGLRLRMMGLRGWLLLLIANFAWLSLFLPMALSVSLASGLLKQAATAFSAAFVALSVGNFASQSREPLFKRWHFTQGPGLLWCVLQTLCVAVVIFANKSHMIATVIITLSLWIGSITLNGCRWDKKGTL